MPPGVVVAVGVDSGYLHTGEIHGRGGAWFAVAVPSSTESSIVRIYRWRGRAWRLDGAVGVPQTPSVQGCAWDLAKPLAISSVACEDGWALATASSGGRPVLALYESWDGRWLRAAVGSAAQLDHNEIFALPQFVLRRLAADVGESLPPPPVPEREPREPSQGEETPPRYMAATVNVLATPGSTYEGGFQYAHGARWLVTALEWKPTHAERRSVLTARVYRWSGRSWAAQATVNLSLYGAQASARHWAVEPNGIIGIPGAFDSVPGEDVDIHEELAPLTSTNSIQFCLGTGGALKGFGEGPAGQGRWFAVLSNVGGSWHLVPFDVNGHRRLSIAAIETKKDEIKAESSHGAVVRYRFKEGVFSPAS
jgi:hypothetical protein